MAKGDLFIVSAPSGAGKTTLIHRILDPDLLGPGGVDFSVSHTTRRPRAGEENGVAYHFVDEATFRSMAEGGEFLEWAEVHGNLYGTSRGEVDPKLLSGRDVLLDIDVQGADQILRREPDAVGIFVLPPSFDELESRLRRRGSEEARSLARRLGVSRWETERYELYRYVIVNEDVESASQALAAIIRSQRQSTERMRGRVVEILRSFPSSPRGLAPE